MEEGALKRNPIVLAIFTFLLLSQGVRAQEQTPEAYTGVAVGTGGTVGGKSIQFDFRITQYNTDDDIKKFAQLLQDKGTDALRRALEKENKGRIAVVGSTGTQIAIARKRTQGADTIITIITPRILPFAELYNNGRSTTYPFGYLQVRSMPRAMVVVRSWLPPKSASTKKADSTRLRASATSTSRPSISGRRNDGTLRAALSFMTGADSVAARVSSECRIILGRNSERG